MLTLQLHYRAYSSAAKNQSQTLLFGCNAVVMEKYPQYTKHFLAYMATLQWATNTSKGSAGQPMIRHTDAKQPGQSLYYGAMWINTFTLYGSLIKPRVSHVPTVLAASIQWKPASTFPSPFLGNYFIPNSKCKPTGINPHSASYIPMHAPETCSLYNVPGGPSLCFQPLQICLCMQILWRRPPSIDMPPHV